MERSRFDRLPLEEKETLLGEYGVSLTSIEYYDYRIHLLSFHAFLIERYENIVTGCVEAIHTASYRDLDKYTSRIVIGRLKKELRC